MQPATWAPTPAPEQAAPPYQQARRAEHPPKDLTRLASSGDTEVEEGHEKQENQLQLDRVCIPPADVQSSVQAAAAAVLKGLPQWGDSEVPAQVKSAVLAYMIQVSFADKLPLVARVFHQIYDTQDIFDYFVDAQMMDVELLREVLPSPLPRNVAVRKAPHAGYYYWPRVQILLDGLSKLLEQRWDFVIHLSESDYPVHSAQWIRRALSQQRQRSFIKIRPRCSRLPEVEQDNWYWWHRNNPVASCESSFVPVEVSEVQFPMQEMEQRGFRFAYAPEWIILSRELAAYATSPELRDYKQLIGMHAAADEIFWATLVLNIPGFTQGIGSMSWYIHWNAGKPGHSPETLTEEHLPLILRDKAQYLFVRKVDESTSGSLLSALDELMVPTEVTPILDSENSDWDGGAVACSGEEQVRSQPLAPFPAPAPPAAPATITGCDSPLCT